MTRGHMQDQLLSSIDYGCLDFLTIGGSGTIYAIDDGIILKEFHDVGIDIERRALERLKGHMNIVRCLGAAPNGLILERGRTVRKVIRESGACQIPLQTKMRWLHEAAEGMRHMHENGILHADTGCHNWIIVQERLKIIDFEGSSIDGEEAGACYEWFSYKESSPRISRKASIFAFGCAMYEVITGKHPYSELLECEDRMIRVKMLYAENRFPEVENMPLGNLMQACWSGTFDSMDELLHRLQYSLQHSKEVKSDRCGVKAVFFTRLSPFGIFERVDIC